MVNSITYERPVKYFILFSAILFIAIFIIENINHRFWLNDFKVFYMAAEAMFTNKQVYGTPFGLDTGFYKYSPFTLLFFAPFTILQYGTAAIIYFFLNAACIIATILILHQIMSKYIFNNRKITFLILFFSLICIINHLVRELHLGNTNMILVLLLSLSLKASLESKQLLAGLLLAFAVLTKPYFLICILPIILFKNYKTVIYFLISVLTCVILTLLVTGFSKGNLLFMEWIFAMKEHSSYLVSQHTIFSLIQHYSGLIIPSSYGIMLLGLTGTLLYFYFSRRYEPGKNNYTQIIFFFLLIAMVPSLLITDTEHFLFSLPLIIILVLHLANFKNYVWIFLFVIIMFMYGGNSSDILGKKLAHNFEEWGILGISNLLLIGAIALLYHNKKFQLIKKT